MINQPFQSQGIPMDRDSDAFTGLFSIPKLHYCFFVHAYRGQCYPKFVFYPMPKFNGSKQSIWAIILRRKCEDYIKRGLQCWEFLAQIKGIILKFLTVSSMITNYGCTDISLLLVLNLFHIHHFRSYVC